MFIVLPERPVITGNPERPVSIGTRVSVVCRSNGTAPGVRLTWFRDGRQVDISFGPYGGEMRNEYSYTVKGSTPETLECRLEYAPADLTYRTSVVISKEGICSIVVPRLCLAVDVGLLMLMTGK